MVNVFLVFTPYHLLLAHTIALQERGRNLIFIVPEFFGAAKMAHLIETKSTLFERVVLLKGVPGHDSFFGKVARRRQNIQALARFAGKEEISNVFVGNDARPEAQFLLSRSKQKNPSCRGAYINDGAAAYASHTSIKSIFRHWIGKMFFGWCWHDVTILGTSPWIDEMWAIFPELVRPELQRISRIPIKKENFLKLKEDPWVRECFSGAFLDSSEFQGIRSFIVLPHSDLLKKYPRGKEAFKNVFSWCLRNKIPVAAKFHPNEPAEQLFAVPKEGVFWIPKDIPFELVYLFQEKAPLFILGDVSTSLLTGRWLFENSRIFSIAPLFSYSDDYLFEVFSRLHIDIAHTAEELQTILGQPPVFTV